MKFLIVIDMQNDFICGALGTEEAQRVVPKVKSKIEAYLSRGDRVVFTRDTHTPNYLDTKEGMFLPIPHCIRGTYGWIIHEELNHPECYHIDKRTFGDDTWQYHFDFKEEDSIEIVGVCTDICVISNALIIKAQFPETDIVVDASCCAGTTPENHKAALEVMKSCQIGVVGETTEVVLDD